MYEIIKHAAKQTTTLFTSPCESMARARFTKSVGLLKLNETLELWHEGKVIDSVSKSLPKDEDGQIIFPEAASTLEPTMKCLYYIAGILPAQSRSSQVDCGIGWKEHVKQEPRKDEEPKEGLNAASPITDYATWRQLVGDARFADSHIEEAFRRKHTKEVDGDIKDTFGFATDTANIQPPTELPIAWFGIDPAAESKPSIGLSTIKPGDKVMLVDGETFNLSLARSLTKNEVYEVCEADIEMRNIRIIDTVGNRVWVCTADIRPISDKQ